MPTYVYKFVETGETIEVQQSFADDSLTEAVHPGSGTVMAVKKVFTPVGVTFKGGGFYKTDSRSGSSSKAPAASSTSSSSGDSAAASTPSTSSTSDSSSTSTATKASSNGSSGSSSGSSGSATPAA